MEIEPNSTSICTIPDKIADEYVINPSSVMRLSGGSINKTLLAHQGDERIILQQLSPIFDEKVIEDFQAVTTHLASKGWDTPSLIDTAGGELSIRDDSDRMWRAMTYIDADPLPTVPPAERDFCHKVGSMVAKLHIDLGDLEYTPKYKLEHFHDTAYHAEKLQALMYHLDPMMRFLAEEVLGIYYDQTGLPDYGSEQLLHGDPKLENMLYKNDAPYTMIDFDTVMHGNIWIDIGDMLRSYSTQPWVTEKSLEYVTEGYYDRTETPMSLRFFARAAQQARKSLTCELAMRHLNDIVEDSYFDWDPSMYIDRAAYNTARAKVQWSRLQDMQV